MRKLCLSWFWFLIAAMACAADAPPPLPAGMLVDGDAALKHWTLPTPPAELKPVPGNLLSVRVRLVLESTGKVAKARVIRSPDPRLNDLAVAAVRGWTFSPEIQDNQPVATSFDVEVPFDSLPTSAASDPKGKGKPLKVAQPKLLGAPNKEAEVKTMVDADYPEELLNRKLPGILRFVCAVDEQGRRTNVTVVYASHVAFVLPALAAIQKWEIIPARKGDLPYATKLRGDVTFDAPAGNHAEILAANFITGPDGSEPSDIPGLEAGADPAWPYELQLAGKGGEANVLFTVNSKGSTEDISIATATQPEFGWAAAAAATQWVLEPPLRGGKPVDVRVQAPFSFTPPAQE